ncbi:MAG: UDP-N-acetylmuramate dehydrogenase [Oscillospiraceae bacterium]|nr:UDP-N-acetylmuramate dehydrogenase [Oscillospiraceae bacterium]
MDMIARFLKNDCGILPGLEARFDEPMKNHTTFSIGGPVRAMYFPDSTDTAQRLCQILSDYEITPLIMGNGSNILASDDCLDIVVINTRNLRSIKPGEPNDGETSFITAESGVLLSELAVYARERGLTGLEFAHGIPGTLGGAVVMNAGAYCGEMKDVVRKTFAYGHGQGIYSIAGNKHEFAYRGSIFTHKQDIVLSSVIELKNGDKTAIATKMEELAAHRGASQPLDKFSAGSIFKRPANGYAAELIERAGLKGYSIRGAQVSPKHAGFIVNNGNASFDDVMALIAHIQEAVSRELKIQLELEVKIIT